MKLSGFVKVVSAIALATAAYGCGGKSSTPVQDMATDGENTPQRSLALPAVPDSLRTPEERASFVAVHFWDKMDFDNGLVLRDSAFMEQSFVDFASILAITSDGSKSDAVDILMRRSSRSRTAFDIVCSLAEKYLDEAESPMRDEESYILFLRNICASPLLSADEKMRPADRLEQALKNRPGMRAANFRMEMRGGRSSELHREAAASDYTLLIFYDPDCEVCKVALRELSDRPLPDGMTVLAVDTEGNRDKWLRSADELPQQWNVGFATEPIADSELYHLPVSPTYYLIDRNATVILKDLSDQTLRSIF